MPSTEDWTNEPGSDAKTFRESLEHAKRAGVPESKLMVEVSGSHSVNCSEKLFIPHISKDRVVSWVFTLTSTTRFGLHCRLKHVFTLDPNLPEFSITNASAHDNPVLTLGQGCQEWQNILKPSREYKVTVQFVSSCYGNFYQRLVFGFHTSPKIVRHLGVMVAPETSLVKQLSYERPSTEDNELNWMNKYELITYSGKIQRGPDISSSPKLPPNINCALEYGSFDHLDATLTKDNYTTRLHTLLHLEEYERRKEMTRLNIKCQDILEYIFPSEEHIDQMCFELPINPDVLEDTQHLINRSSRAIVKLIPPKDQVYSGNWDKSPRLYEVLAIAIKKDSIVFLSNNALSQVLMNASSPLEASVCFRFVDTYKYMHNAIDNVNLECVFPSNPDGLSLDWDVSKHPFLNKPQTTALSHILDPRPKPPLLIFGPFGTGKTRTIAEAVKELCRLHSGNPDENLRILICTHSNSAADHYIVNYLHPFFTSSQLGNELCTTLRICWEDRFLKAVSPTVLQYSYISQDTGKFAVPPKNVLDNHRVVVTTLVTADVLTSLGLPRGYFSHVFIDEAAQAMEAETLIPLCLCIPSTRVVLAGDHLQLGAMVYSPVARHLALDRSLLVRLYEYYPRSSSCKLLLLENYRAYQEIVDIPSKLFYEGTLVAHKTRPPSSTYPVHFHGVLGKESRAPDIPSYYNMAEAAEISERIECLVNEWCSDYDDDNSVEENICVLAPYTAQVREIRQLLRKRGLGQVRVEGVNNVQGLEFDAVFISTVHTSYSMTADTIDRQDMGFLSDPRLLNTAVTRAKYQLVIVGDPSALCGAGDCKVCWKKILSKCNENGTFNYRLSYQKVIEYTKLSSQTPTEDDTGIFSHTQLIDNTPVTSKHFEYQRPVASNNRLSSPPIPEPVAVISTVSSSAMPSSTFPDPNTPASYLPGSRASAVLGSDVSCSTLPGSNYPLQNSTFPGSTIPGPAFHVSTALSSVPSYPMYQSMVPRPGLIQAAYPYGPAAVDPRGRLVPNVMYPAGQVQSFPGQNASMVQPIPFQASNPYASPPSLYGTVLAPSGQQGQVRLVAQPPIGYTVSPSAQPPWQLSPQQFVRPRAGSPNIYQVPVNPVSKSVTTPNKSTISASNSPSTGNNSPYTNSPNSCTLTGTNGNQDTSSNLEYSPPREVNYDPAAVNGIRSPSGHSTGHIIRAIMYDIQYRRQILSEEQHFLVELSANGALPKELQESILKQIQLTNKEIQLASQRLSLHRMAAEQLDIDCSDSVPGTASGMETLTLDRMAEIQLKRLSLESDEEIKKLFPQTSLEEKNSHSEEFEDSDSEEWFLARREDPLVQEYIKAFESFAESFFKERDGRLHEGSHQLESFNWVLTPQCNETYIGNSIHQEYEDEGSVVDKLLNNDLLLCTLEVNGVNSGIAKVLAWDVKAMVMGSGIEVKKDSILQDITISNRVDMNRAFHGDIVAVKLINTTTRRPSGRVVYIFKKVHPREAICTVDILDLNVMIPVDKANPNIFVMQSREHRDIKGVSIFSFKDGEAKCKLQIPPHQAKECLFLVTVLEWGANYRLPLGIVRKYFKKYHDLNSVVPILAAECGVRVNLPDDVVKEVKNTYHDSFQVPETEWLSRAYRYNNVFTMDCGESLGLELDDAISIIKEKGGTYSVGVHVSDVSYFVQKGSCIDRAAFAQGASLYPEQHNDVGITMLPSRLSQNLCSLLPKQDRLAISVIFRLDKDGQLIKQPDIHRSVVSSCCSLTFKECDEIIAGRSSRRIPGNLKGDLQILENLTRKIALRNIRLGCTSGSTNLIHNSELNASQIIEQLMIMANAAVAQRLLLSPRTKYLTPLRRQLQPKRQYSESLVLWCAENGVIPNGSLTLQRLPGSETVRQESEVPVELSCLGHISTAVNARDLNQLTEALLRCDNNAEKLEAYARFSTIQERGQYIVSSHSSGPQLKHFSLGQDCYTHFTSPLRRYFDLVVHRCLLALIYDKPFPYTLKELQEICLQCQITSARVNSFEKRCSSISLAQSLTTSQQLRSANVERVSLDRITLNFNTDEGFRPFNRSVKVQDLGPDRAEFENEQDLVMTWNKQNLSCSSSSRQRPTSHENSTESPNTSYFVKVPAASWVTFIQEVTRGNLKRIVRQWKKVNSSSLAVHPSQSIKTSGTTTSNDGTSRLTSGSKVNVVLGSEVRRGLLQPVIRGIQISSSAFSCVSHRHNPETVFCPVVSESTEFLYENVDHYSRVMLPLIELESAASTVRYKKTVQLCGVNVSWQASGNSVRGSTSIQKDFCESHDVALTEGDYLCIRNEEFPTDLSVESFVLIHGCIHQIIDHSGRLDIVIDITEPANTFSADTLQSHAHKYTIEVIHKRPRFKYMIEAVKALETSTILRSIVTHHDLPGTPAKLDIPILRYFPLDIDQEEAVKCALNSPFTVIYGQPGTGKTWTAVAIACHFINHNWQSRAGQVMVCAPNNKALDVIAKMFVKIPSVNVLRLYCHDDEQHPSNVIKECKPLALHLRVRGPENPHANALLMCIHEIDQLKLSLEQCETDDQENLQKKLASKKQKLAAILDAAEYHEFTKTSVHVILCTCSEAGSARVRKFSNISQCIVDECNACIDAELLVPLVLAGQQCQHIVLIGDPKQLVPVFCSKRAVKHGLNRSLFEDLIDSHVGKKYECRLLRMQFRMHPSIRVFSSEHFYKDNFKPVFDAIQVTNSTVPMEGLWQNSQECRSVFCHVVGEEFPNQNESDWWNPEEVEKVEVLVEYIKSFGFTSEHMCIISPYTIQRQRIQNALGDPEIQIISPIESQGIEQQFVIFSTVLSKPPMHPGKIGCLGDVHQLNVVFTRARLGLIIVGNKGFLSTIPTWRTLLSEYDTDDCVLDGSSWP